MIDMDLLSVVFEMLCCPSCHKNMLKLFEENRYGLSCELKLKCCNSNCHWEHNELIKSTDGLFIRFVELMVVIKVLKSFPV